MPPNRSTAALIFLAAVAAIAAQEVLPNRIGESLMLLLLVGILAFLVYRKIRRVARGVTSLKEGGSSMSRYGLRHLMVLCIVTSIGFLCVNEFFDYDGRKLPIFGQSLIIANHSPVAGSLLGLPIRASWPVKRSGDLSDSAHDAHLIIPVTGQNHAGKLIVDAVNQAQHWKITRLVVIENGASDTPGTSQDITPVS